MPSGSKAGIKDTKPPSLARDPNQYCTTAGCLRGIGGVLRGVEGC